MGLILFGNAGAVVRYGQDRIPAGTDQPHADHPALLGVFAGVLHQVVHHLRQLRAVGIHVAAVVELEFQLLMTLLHHQSQAVRRVGDHLRQAEGGAV